MKHVVFLTGAGISAESGISTFRDSGGLWENHNIEEVASIDGWHKNPELVLDFYNQRRLQLEKVKPNDAHFAIAGLEENFEVSVITQNIDNLHEISGSTNIIHLHGELTKACNESKTKIYEIGTKPILLGDKAEDGSQLRPFIVWFGEDVPKMSEAKSTVKKADFLIVIGTSLQVYPAASLIDFAPENCKIFYIDPQGEYYSERVMHIYKKATAGMKEIEKMIISL